MLENQIFGVNVILNDPKLLQLAQTVQHNLDGSKWTKTLGFQQRPKILKQLFLGRPEVDQNYEPLTCSLPEALIKMLKDFTNA